MNKHTKGLLFWLVTAIPPIIALTWLLYVLKAPEVVGMLTGFIWGAVMAQKAIDKYNLF